ncbi:hypothetical protein [Pseudomonas viridiflava]|uniref:hypothetical protein n=1 Tax=Pseudomonas viridiflava TaxID=33069 RepID=UPI000F04B228|nr:hypothetical protein [Pseudomonas viridiflava]
MEFIVALETVFEGYEVAGYNAIKPMRIIKINMNIGTRLTLDLCIDRRIFDSCTKQVCILVNHPPWNTDKKIPIITDRDFSASGNQRVTGVLTFKDGS